MSSEYFCLFWSRDFLTFFFVWFVYFSSLLWFASWYTKLFPKPCVTIFASKLSLRSALSFVFYFTWTLKSSIRSLLSLVFIKYYRCISSRPNMTRNKTFYPSIRNIMDTCIAMSSGKTLVSILFKSEWTRKSKLNSILKKWLTTSRLLLNKPCSR